MEPRTRIERSIAFALRQTDELPPAHSRLDHFLNELAETVRLGAMDLTDYYKKTEVDTLLQNKVDVEPDKDLMLLTEKQQLADNTAAIELLNADNATVGSVDSKVLDALNSAKTYTDEQVAAMDLTDEQIAESVNRSMAAGDIKGSVTTQTIDFNGVNHPVGSPLEEIILAILEFLQAYEEPTT